MKEKTKVALAQISCKQGDKEKNLKIIEDNVKRGKQKGAQLIIFPELSLTGYTLRDRVYELAETIPGRSTTLLEELAKKTETYIIFGMPERSENTQATIHNTAVLVGPQGLIGKYRKMYLPTHSVFEEKRYFRPGNEAAVFETELGKIGLSICYDIFFPEVSRLTRLKGAQLMVCISASPTIRRAFFEILTAARAIENTAFLAYVNLAGTEDGLQFWGGSRLIGPSGRVLAKAKYDEEELVISEIKYAEIRPIEVFVPILKDLRPELFLKLKESAEKL
jgi:predicted amidohydrolase